MLKFLIQQGLDVNEIPNNGSNLPMLKFLFQKGFDFNEIPNDGSNQQM